jgi:hypothetical protein
MIHPEEKLYGWGVCGITMPRALDTIHPDKRKTSVKIPSATRRKVASRLWRSSGVSRIFIDDLPWSQLSSTEHFQCSKWDSFPNRLT